MKVFIAFVFVVHVLSGIVTAREIPEEDQIDMKYFLVETSEGVYEVEDLVNSKIELRASEADITYHFYSKSNPIIGTVIKHTDLSVLRNTGFHASKDTLFVVHGWKSNSEGSINYHIREAVLSRYDVNVFVVDWNPVAAQNYISAKNAVLDVGTYIGTFIKSLASSYNLQISKVACVGHSLGAHVCGNAGAALNGQIHHIVGLDPASPLFSLSNTGNRLDPSDAEYVQIIHTNGGLLGFAASIGHADYFPNGGKSQPGCGLDIAGSCAHSRSYMYYAETILINSNLFNAKECASYSDFTKGLCNSNAESLMGGYGIDTSARGDYYLDTNSGSPYAKG